MDGPLPRFDYSINLLETLVLPFVIWAARGMYVFLNDMREEIRDLRRIVGKDDDDHQTGLCRIVHKFGEDLLLHKDALKDLGWLERRSGTDRRRGGMA